MTVVIVAVAVVLLSIVAVVVVWGDARLAEKIQALDDESLVLLRDGVYRNPRGLKGVHIRMVTSECARRGL